MSFNSMSSQQVFANIGRNLTKYSYTNSDQKTDYNFKNTFGSNYEVGVEFALTDKIYYLVSATLNQFNSFTKIESDSFTWETNYVGIQNAATYTVFNPRRSGILIKAKAGVNLMTILSGFEEISGVIYEIQNEPEFDGLFIQPLVGLEVLITTNSDLSFIVGYNISTSFKAKAVEERISFTNNQLQVGVSFPF
jgi:hypothetical protein